MLITILALLGVFLVAIHLLDRVKLLDKIREVLYTVAIIIAFVLVVLVMFGVITLR